MAGAAGGGGHSAIQIEAPAASSSPVQDQLDEGTIRRRLKLYQAAIKGDWEVAEAIFRDHREEINAELTVRKETALHVATLAENTKFVRKLVNVMTSDDLLRVDIEQRTALSLAALTGRKELAQVIMDKNPKLAQMRTIEGLLPLHTAAFSGHKEMVEFLRGKHDFLKEQDDSGEKQDDSRKINSDLVDLLVGLINSDMLDIAQDVLLSGKDETLLLYPDSYGETAFSAIARKPQMLSKSGFFARLLCSKAVQKKVRQLLTRVWEKLAIMNEAEIIEVVGSGWRTIFVAVENGNVEFLRILIGCYPDLVTKTNEEGHSIFHAAIQHRQHEVFELIHTIGSMKKMIAAIIDVKGNHMLHLASQPPSLLRLQSISGEALQLQNELKWFKEVEKVMGPRLAKERNIFSNSPQTPREIFIENHKYMIRRGEAHVKKTADSCILVAILVTTVVFAAAYTVAGGFDPKGYPIFLHDMSFKIFAVAVAVSLVSSVTSVLTFLSLLTSTYALDEFVWWIPTKLLLGFLTLLVSLVSMLVAFITVFFMYFKQHHTYGILVAAFSCVPPLLFVVLQGQFFKMMKSTLFTPN